MAPAHRATPLASILPMGPADGVRLSAQADIMFSGQRVSGVLECLPKWRAAVAPLIAQAGTDIKMGIDVNNADRSGAGDIPKIMTVSGLMPATQNNWNRAFGQNTGHHGAESGLRILQTPVD